MSKRKWPFVLAACCGLAYVFFPPITLGQPKTPPRSTITARSVPVVAASARKGDMSVYLTGLGTATALNTVTVRSRVDGQLVNVAFQEGQVVRQGDLLAEIDPRPFQVQLTHAEGQEAKDSATRSSTSSDIKTCSRKV